MIKEIAIYRHKLSNPNDARSFEIELWVQYPWDEPGLDIMILSDSKQIKDMGWKVLLLYKVQKNNKQFAWETQTGEIVCQMEFQ